MGEIEYETNLPRCRKISAPRAVQVGDLLKLATNWNVSPVDSYFADALVVDKVGGKLWLKVVRPISCIIRESDHETDADQPLKGASNSN